MPFLTDKVWDGELVRLQPVETSHAERILAAWGDEPVASTWRHHKPRTLEEERAYLQKLVDDPDRWSYIVERKADEQLVATIGLETNTKKDQSGENRFGPLNCRVARMGMLLLRENPWEHNCEKEAIRLLLDATFHQEFRADDGTPFKICDVNVRVNVEDELTIGVLIMLGFKIPNIKKRMEYHGRQTIFMDYSPPPE